jgi:hypothetical protein
MKCFRTILALSILHVCTGCSSRHDREPMSTKAASMSGGERSLLDERATARDVSFAGTSVGALPAGWKVEGTNQDGPLATWNVVADATAPGGSSALALTSSNHDSGSTFNLCWTGDVRFEDGALEVSMKSVSGKEDQGGGLIWRVKDKDDYYVCRANPLEGNFRVYCVEEGRRRQLASASLPIASGEWHTFRIEHVGDRIACSLDGERLLEARDETIRGEGGIGLWTKADAASEFAALRVTSK